MPAASGRQPRIRIRMRLSGIVSDSIVDGPGLRYVVFTQGCAHRCEGCHNPGTHDPAGGYEISPEELVADFERTLADDPLLDGITLSGGEPFDQARSLIPLADAAHRAGLTVWAYTGWTIDELAERADPDEVDLLRRTDTLVDGRFIQSLRTLERRFIGSSNQRIIDRPFEHVITKLREGL